ncbi:hypothetical protein CH63R_09577 [Colletotrichum higginsianum IMI 349063]|uniref:Uncharacterized protein n=1 Tax=Colletotrichum higginsianum (strain IMI 349063) TaxID=759273 RepID=A0A1B7Y7P8_COLHI|nr:hypothetical protein CH63R_09577 [Colletotrichum higginsianum IMI 349063]OBR08056.1 hypothetical protein CH63R_09577 [Colletotrichum higginsianum IMI 349063]
MYFKPFSILLLGAAGITTAMPSRHATSFVPLSDMFLAVRAPQAPEPKQGTATKVATTPETSDPHDKFDPGVVTGGTVQCLSGTAPSKTDQLKAELAICGGIRAPINNCPGTEQKSTGTAGQALWTLEAAENEKINIFKGTWEECCNAGRATCKGKAFSLQCEKGTDKGNPVTITLSTT